MSSPESEEAERMAMSMEDMVREVVKDAIYEAHEEGVHSRTGSRRGRSMLPMLLVGVGIVAIGYLMRRRSGSVTEMAGTASEGIKRAADMTAERTERMTGSAAERVREQGQKMTSRTESMSENTAERIKVGGEDAADQIEKGGEEVGDRMEGDDTDTSSQMGRTGNMTDENEERR